MQSKIRQHVHLIERARSVNLELAIKLCANRLNIVVVCVCLCFLAVIVRLVQVSTSSVEEMRRPTKSVEKSFSLNRATITDRNGEILATNISTSSLHANPAEITNKKEAATKLAQVLSISYDELLHRFTNNKTFVWIKRHLSPKERQAVHDLGLPGTYFTNDESRMYPQASLFAHTIGYVDIDGKGLAGVERHFNDKMIADASGNLVLSLDARVQAVLRDELLKGIELNQAIGGSGVIMNANNGEILAMVSLPDFDPNNLTYTKERNRFNQITLGLYEMGSTFKIFTTAMALDLGKVNVNDSFDVSAPLQLGRFKVNDFKGKGGMLTVPEILMYSSNIGTAQIAQHVGIKNQQAYMKNFGFLDKLNIEIPEVSPPLYPSSNRWSDISLATISYGHGIAVTPLHLAQATAAVVNGGTMIQPSLILGGSEAGQGDRVISRKTSELMRKIMRLAVTTGSGRRSDIEGYYIGGKTGTSEKVSGRGYNKNVNLSLYVSAYPIHEPKYVVLIVIDEAKPNQHNGWSTLGGAISAPIAGAVIQRISSILKVYPYHKEQSDIEEQLTLDFKPKFQKLAARN